LSFDYGKEYYIEVRNTGDAITNDLQVYFYISDVPENDIYLSRKWWYKIGKLSDESAFSDSYQYKGADKEVPSLNPKETLRIHFHFTTRNDKGCKASVLLKIYYGQPEPKIFPFEIVIRGRVVK